MLFVNDTLCCSLVLHCIKTDAVIYMPINKREMRGLYRPVAPLMLRTRGAVHQPVNSLPSGWPSISPLYGTSHLNNPSSLPCSSLSPSPTAPLLCLLCPRPSLVCSFPCLRSCFPTLARAESSDPRPPRPISTSTPPPHRIIAQCTPMPLASVELFMFQSFDIAWLPF